MQCPGTGQRDLRQRAVGQGPHCVRNRTRKRHVANKCGRRAGGFRATATWKNDRHIHHWGMFAASLRSRPVWRAFPLASSWSTCCEGRNLPRRAGNLGRRRCFHGRWSIDWQGVRSVSRDARGHVERIRITETTQTGSGRSILIIGNTDFLFTEGAIRLNLSIAELGATPKAMPEDKASD